MLFLTLPVPKVMPQSSEANPHSLWHSESVGRLPKLFDSSLPSANAPCCDFQWQEKLLFIGSLYNEKEHYLEISSKSNLIVICSG